MLGVLCVAVMILTGTLLSGCNQNTGKLYDLEEVYNNEWLFAEDLQTIADLYNANETLKISDLGDKIAEKIKKTVVNEIKERIPEAKAEEIRITAYYGVYQDCYAVMLYVPYYEYPAVVVDEWQEIGGVRFHHTGFNRIQVWKDKE